MYNEDQSHIAVLFQSNTFVECLDLSDNDIGCDGMVSIAHMLTENYFITELSKSLIIIIKWYTQGFQLLICSR